MRPTKPPGTLYRRELRKCDDRDMQGNVAKEDDG